MPSTRARAAAEDEAETKAVAQLFAIRLQQLEEKGLKALTVDRVRKDRMTIRDLFRRTGFRTEDICAAIPVADSTLRGIASGRTNPTLAVPLMKRFLTLLDCDFDCFAEAHKNTLEAREEKELAVA